MDIKLGTTFTLFQPGRKQLTPSFFLCVFRDVDTDERRQAITQSIGDAVGPLLLELTEGTSDPLEGVVQLYSGDWVLTVYEQTSATNLDAANANRTVWSELVRVSAQCDADPGPQPYDPCAGCEGGPCEPLNYSLADTDGNILLSGIEEDPCGKELPLVAPDGIVTRDGQPFGSVLSGGTIDVPSDCDPCPIDIEVRNSAGTLVDSDTVEDACEQGRPVELLAPDATPTWGGLTWVDIPSGTSPDFDCSTNVPAAYVQDGGSRTGTYKADGTVNGKTRWRLDANHTLEYSGTRWELLHPGPTEQAAPGNEDFPWQADWSGTGITVTQATIGQYCDDCPEPEPCPLEVNINDTPFVTVEDPCATPTLGIAVENEDGATVGNEVDGVWVVPTAKSLCTLVQEAETTEEITDCIISAGKRPAVQCVLLGATDAGDVVDEVYDCLTAGAQTALETAICSREVFLRFQFEAQDNQSVTFTIDADSAGTYTALTQDGSSGTITVSINGGAYGAFVNPTTLVATDTIAVQRTSFASLGFVTITGTY